MGSYGNAIMAGFICRLCSEQKRCVIHLYSAKAKKLALLKKITLIPIKVDKYDKLPKTICESCIEKLDMQYKLIQQIKKTTDIHRTHRLFHNNGQCPVECPLYGMGRDSWGVSDASTSTSNERANHTGDTDNGPDISPM